jgi:hypothetical protein
MSQINDIFKTSGFVPALQKVFADKVTYTLDGVSIECEVIFSTTLEEVGDYGERMEPRTTIEAPSDLDFKIGGIVTTYETPRVDWVINQILADDGLLATFSIRCSPTASSFGHKPLAPEDLVIDAVTHDGGFF